MTSDATVLIVEDQRGLAEAYQTVASKEYNARVATSGEEALEKIDETVDVVVLDRRMPGMSGDEVLAEFRDRGVKATVTMLTAVEPDVDVVEMPLDDYVTKPIDGRELLELVDALVERTRLDEQVQQFFSLAAKQVALEMVDKENTTAYEGLTSDLEQLREDLGSKLDDVDEELDPRSRVDWN